MPIANVAARYSEASSLLVETDNQSADWQTRARFLLPELTGACGNVPDFGRVRTFNLRGMKLTLRCPT